MQISSLPEWQLTPVRHLEPGQEQAFPRLFEAERPNLDLVDWIDRRRPEIEHELVVRGAVLFRGFAVNQEADFERSARALAVMLEGAYGDLVKRRTADFVYDATWYPSDRAILFHNEGSHTPRLPTRQLFYCSCADFSGGETPIVDCREVYRSLEPSLRRRFEEHGLLYLRNFIRGVDVRWQDFFRTEERAAVERQCHEQGVEWQWRPDGSLRTRTRAPAVVRHPVTGEPSFCNQLMLHHVACLDGKTGAALRSVLAPEDLPRNVCFGDGGQISDEVVAEVLRVTVRTAVRFTWRRGDILLLDNVSVAHARAAFQGTREILVAVGDVRRRDANGRFFA